MRDKIGMIFGISGIILLILPDLQNIPIKEIALLIMYRYWPLCLILIGLCISGKTKKKSKKKRST